MKYVRLLVISFLVLFLCITGISLFIPSHVRISRALNITAANDSVMAQVKDASKWKNWYPGLDTAQLLYVTGQVKGVILDASDISKPVTIIIDKTGANEVTAQFTPKKMKPVINGWSTIPYPGGDSLNLQWYMDFQLRWYPWEKFASLLLEKSYGPKMEQGLSRIKTIVEN